MGPEPERNARTWSRSRSGCCARIGFVPRSGSETKREVDLRLQLDIEQRADARQHAAAQRIEIALQQIGDQDDRRQPKQRCDVAAGDDAIIHLQHVDRAGKRQQVDYAAEYSHARQTSCACAQLNGNRVVPIERPHSAPPILSGSRRGANHPDVR